MKTRQTAEDLRQAVTQQRSRAAGGHVRRRVAKPRGAPASNWNCEHCGRPGSEVLAAHRLDAIRTTLRRINDCAESHCPELRARVRRFASKLEVPYLALLECVDDAIAPSDIVGLPTTRCTAVANTDCANEAAGSTGTIRSVRALAGIEMVVLFLKEVEEAYSSNIFTEPFEHELAKSTGLPYYALEVAMSAVAFDGQVLADIEAFIAWRAAEPVAAKMLEGV